MRTRNRRVLSLLLVIAMVFSMLPAPMFAETGSAPGQTVEDSESSTDSVTTDSGDNAGGQDGSAGDQTSTGETGDAESGETGDGETGDAETGETGDGETGDAESGETGDTESGETGDGETGDAETGETGDGETGDAETGETGDAESGETGDGETGDAESGETGDAESGETGDAESGETGDAETGETGDVETGETGDVETGTLVPGEEQVIPPVMEEVIYEDQTISSSIGTVTVTVTGYLPQGATVSVLPVTGSIDVAGVKVLGAYDINILDKDGNIIQPDDTVSVNIADSALAGEKEVNVYHAVPVMTPKVAAMNNVAAVAPATEIATEVSVENRSVDFETDHFSIYVIGTPYVATYIFTVDGEAVSTQYLKNGEFLQAPATPADKNNAKFIGWYMGDALVDFSQPVSVLADAQITVEAKFSDVCYVYFCDSAKVLVTKEVQPGGTVDDSNVPYIPSSGQALSHWSTGIDGTEAFDFSQPITDDVTLYAVTFDCHWVTFDSQGGSIMPMIPVANGDTVSEPLTIPARAGYRFSHWSETIDGAAYNFSLQITADKTLYAVWIPNSQVMYTVLHWQENADDSGYTFKESETKWGTAGQLTDARAKSYSNFTAVRPTNVTISGDGSTVVNVYYTRNVYTLTFQVPKRYGIGYNTVATITAKYGAEISGEFNKAPFNTTYAGRAWEATSYYNYPLQTLDRMPNQNVTFRLYWKSSETLKTIYYYVQSVNSTANPNPNRSESWPSSPNNDYTLLKEVKTYFNYATYDEEYHEIQGFTRFSANASGFNNNAKDFSQNKLYLYYIRNSYNLEYHNVNSTAKTESVKYQKSLAGYDAYVPNRPSGIAADWTFQGWYDNPECAGNSFDFANSKMPAGNLIVYAKWAPPAHKAIAFYDAAGISGYAEIPVGYGQKLDQSKLPVLTPPEGLDAEDFLGWFWYVDGKLMAYNFNYVLTQNIELFPQWNGGKYQVTYDKGTGEGSAPVDSKYYAYGAKAAVLGGGALTGPEASSFLCWTDESGNKYYANDKITIVGNVKLTANYGKVVIPQVTITYDANYTGADPATYTGPTIPKNSTFTVATSAAAGFNREGYEFAGWNTKADGSGKAFAAGATARADETLPNTLYARWNAIDYTVSYKYTGVVPQGAPAAPVAQTGKHVGDSITVAAAPTFNGYTFDGWYMGSDKVTSFNMPADDVELTGHWVENSITIKITGKNDTVTYTGSEQSVSGFTTDAPDTVSVSLKTGRTAEAKGTDAGTYYMGLTAEDFTATSTYYNEINITVEDGWLKIDPKSEKLTVKVKGNTDTVTYTGSEQSVSGFTTDAPTSVTVSLKTGKTAEAKGTDAGTYKMGLTAEDFTATSKNYTNIVIVVEDGWLKIDPKNGLTVKVKGNTDTVTYTGSEQSVSGFTSDAPKTVTVSLVAGRTAEAKGTNANTYYMGLKAADFTATSKNYSNIEIVVEDGWLKIDPKSEKLTVNVKGNTGTVTYTGSEQSVSGFTTDAPASVTVSLVAGKTAEAKGTDAGTYNMNLKAADFTATSKNYSNIEIVVEDGWLKVDPKSGLTVNVKGNTGTVTYSGSEQGVSGFTTDAPASVTVSLVAGRTAEAKGTDAGTYYMGLTGKDFTAVSKNYTNIEVIVTDGWLRINPDSDKLTVKVKGNTDTVTYTGSEQSVSGFTTDAPETVTVALKSESKAEAKGTDAGTYYMNLKAADFTATSKNYSNIEIVVEDGWLKIDPKSEKLTVKVKGNTDTVTYTGSEQSVSGFTSDAPATVTVSLVAARTAEAKGTDAGTYYMNLKAADFTATSKNYSNIEIVVEDGWLKVDPKSGLTVNVKGNTGTVTYSGSEQSVSGFTSDAPASVTVALKSESKAEAKGTDAGTYYMNLKAADFTATSKNYSNIEIVVEDGWLKIDPKSEKLTVKVKGNTDTVTYTGSEQSVSGFTSDAPASVTVALKSESKAEAKGTNTGTYYMGLTGKDFTAVSKNYTNIEVIVTDGWLKIDPKSEKLTVKVKGNTDTVTYTGSEQSVSGFTTDAPETVTVALKSESKAEAKGTNTGTYYMGLTAEDFTAASNNYTNIEILVEDGWLKIDPKNGLTVNIKGNQKTVTYTGSEQSVSGFTTDAPTSVTVALKSESKAEAKGTNTGTYYMGLTAEDFTATSNNYTNIVIVVEDGWLKIDPKSEKLTVNVKGNTDTVTYTGSEQSVSGFTADAPTSVTVSLKTGRTAEAKGTDANTYKMGLTAEDFTATSNNYTNIEILVEDGWLKIDPKSEKLTVNVKGNTDTLTYTGSEQSVSGFTSDAPETVTVALAEGAAAEAKGTDANTYYMNLKAADFTATSNNYTNIEIVVEDGWLKIDPKSEKLTVNVKGNTDTLTYTGSEQSVSGFATNAPASVTVALAEGAAAEAKGTDAGTYYMNLKAADFTATSKNYTNIEIVVEDGWLKIDPKSEKLTVNVKGNTDTVTYTGSEQSVSGFTTDAPETVTVALKSESKTEAKGTDAGTYYMNLKAADFTATSKNYTNIEIVVEDGWLKIDPKNGLTVNIKGNQKTVTYTASEQSVSGFTSNAPETVTVALVETKTAEAKGTNANTYYMGLTAEDFTAASDNYTNIEIVVEDGWLKIDPKSEKLTVNIKGNTDTLTYTGFEQSVSGFTSDAPETVTVSLVAGKTAEAKGTDAGTYKMGLTSADFTATSKNYTNIEIVVEDGWLKIDPKNGLTVNIKGNTDTVTYTGSEQSVSGFTSDAPETVTVALVETKTAEAKGTDANTYKMGLTAEDFTATSNNYTNIEIVVEDGWLKIDPKNGLTVNVKGNTDTVTYTGSEQSVSGFTSDAPETVTVALVETKTAEAKGTNANTYYMGLTSADFTATSNNYTNIEIVVEDGWLKINPAGGGEPIYPTLIVESYEGVYDGKEHSVTVKGLVDGDKVYYLELENVPEGEEQHAYETEMKPMFTDATAARIIKVRVQNPNFEDRTGEGTVTITPRPLTITAGSASKRHDGQPLTDASYTITGGSLAEEQELTSVTVTGSQTDVGSSANVPSAAVIKTIVPETAEAQTPREVTANYAITYLNGTLTVTRRSSGGGGDPTPTPEPEPIPEPEPEVVITEPEVPQAELPGETTDDGTIIIDEAVPLGNLPQTGTTSSQNAPAAPVAVLPEELRFGWKEEEEKDEEID